MCIYTVYGVCCLENMFYTMYSHCVQIKDFYHTLLKFDGLWIDMNEISNFCNGECSSVSEPTKLTEKLKFDPNNPPYKINNQGTNTGLNIKTLDMDAKHFANLLEYDAHNLFGVFYYIHTQLINHC